MKSSTSNSLTSKINKLNTSSTAKQQTISNFSIDDSETSSTNSILEAKTFLQHSFRKITATREYAFSKNNLRREKWKVALFCGERNSVGHKNGPFKETRFDGLYDFCILQNGNILVSETMNNTIRILSLTEQRTRSFVDQTHLLKPKGMCTLPNGTVLVCDSGHHRIRSITMEGADLTNFAGSGKKGKFDGKLLSSKFNNPSDIVVLDTGVIIIADTGNHCLRKIDIAKGEVEILCGGKLGYKDGLLKDALFNEPTGLLIDFDGGILVCDTGNNAIRKISKDLSNVFSVAGGSFEPGYRDGINSDALFSHPQGFCLTSNGNILVCDTGNNCIRMIENGTNVVTTFAGSRRIGMQNGGVEEALFNAPRAILCINEIDREVFLVADSANNLIRIIYPIYDDQLSIPSPIIVEKPSLPTLPKPPTPKVFDLSDMPSYYHVVFKNEEQLTNIFLYYADILNTKYEVTELSQVKFLKFVKECKLVDDKYLTTPNISLIFYEVTKSNNESTGGKSSAGRMSFDNFINALCLLATKKYQPEDNLATLNDVLQHHDKTSNALARLLAEYVFPNARTTSLEPSVEELSERAVVNLWSKHEAILFKIFSFYASTKSTPSEASNWNSYVRGMNTLNIEEFYSFAKDFEIFPNFGSKSKLNKLFRSCSMSIASIENRKLDNDILPQERVALDFFGFLELLGRIALMKYSEEPLCDVYKTTVAKIEALLEHMHLSKGRLKFASELGSRLFKGLNSPIRKNIAGHAEPTEEDELVFRTSGLTMFKRIKEKKPFSLSELSKSYTEYSTVRKKEEKNFNLLEEKAKFDLTRIQSRLTMKVQERVMVACDNVSLYILDEKANIWNFLCTGSLKLTVNPELMVPTKSPHILRFTEKGTDLELSTILSSQNLPVVDHDELFHVWFKGTSSLFNDGNTYSIQFPDPPASAKFADAYEKVRNFDRQIRSNSPGRYFAKMSAMTREMNELSKPEEDKPVSLPPQEIVSSTNLTNSSTSPTMEQVLTSGNTMVVSPSKSILKKKDPMQATKSPSKTLRFNLQDFERNNEYSDLEQAKDQPNEEDQLQEEQLSNQELELLEDKVSRIEKSSPKDRSPQKEFLQTYENVASDVVSYVVEKLLDNQSPKVKDEVKQKLQVTSGLYYAGALETLQNEPLQSQPNTESDDDFGRERKRILARALINLDPAICSKFNNLEKYYDLIVQCLDDHDFYTESYVKDSLGMNMFVLSNHFCVVKSESLTLNLNFIGNLFEYANFPEIEAVKVASAKSNDFKEFPLIYDQDKTAAVLNVPLIINVSDPDSSVKEPVFEKYSPLLDHPVLIRSLDMKVLVQLNSQTDQLYATTLSFKFAIFSSQQDLDRAYSSIRKEISEEADRLASLLKPLKFFSTRDSYSLSPFVL